MRTLFVAGVVALLVLASAPAAALTPSERAAQDGSAAAQEAPVSTWNETYGGSGDDRLAGVTPTDDGYVLTGWSEGEQSMDGWVLKIDDDGAVQWEQRFGGGAFDKLYAALPTADGYLLVGENGSSSGTAGWLVKISADGERQWEREYGSGGFWAGERTEEGYLLAGWTRADGADGWAMHVDADGEPQWERTYDGPTEGTDEYVKSVVVDEDGYLLAGVSESGDGAAGWAVRTDAAGNATWSDAYGDEAVNDVWAATNATDDGYVLAGETGGEDASERDAWALALDGDGAVTWERTYGGEEYDWFDAVVRAGEDGYVFTGGTQTGDFGSADGYLVRTGADGEPALETSFGSTGWDKSWPIVEANDGGYLLVGETHGFGADGKDGWATRMTGVVPNETVNESALDGETETATDEPATNVDGGAAQTDGQPGFTAVAALVALVSLLGAAALRRRG